MFNKNFWHAATERAIRTMAQAALPVMGSGAIWDIDWMQMLGITLGAGLMSILTAVATGLPETDILAPIGTEYIE